MLQTASPLFSRMIEGRSSVALPANSSHINHSSNTTFFRQNITQGYSLKFVVSGTEKYEINGRRHAVGAGQFLIVANGAESQVEIKATKPVEGFCIYLNSGQVKDVWTNLHTSEEHLLADKDEKLLLPEFYENVFNAGSHPLGGTLQEISQEFRHKVNPEENLTEELFYNLAQELCLLQAESKKHLHLLPALKAATREELYRRIRFARDYIHSNFSRQISLAELAEISSLSEFHFLRTFKAVFGQSPYRFLLLIRLEHARQLLTTGNYGITEIALLCGFREAQAFSKLFRKEYGISPNVFRENRK